MDRYNEAKLLYEQGKSLRQISKELNINRKLLSKKLKEDGIVIRDINKNNVPKSKRIHKLNDKIFETIDTEEKAYWLGFLYADGYVNSNKGIELSLKESDYEHLIKFQQFMGCDNNIVYRPIQKAYRIGIYSKKIAQDLINLGCVQAKSLILEFPTEEQVPKHLISHFMRGYFDGDGSLTFSQGQLRFSVLGTSKFLDIYESFILNCLDRKTSNKRSTKSDSTVESIQYGGNTQVFKIFNFLYNDATIYLERKHAKYIAVLGQEEDNTKS
jgi:hypothetical protein